MIACFELMCFKHNPLLRMNTIIFSRGLFFSSCVTYVTYIKLQLQYNTININNCIKGNDIVN